MKGSHRVRQYLSVNLILSLSLALLFRSYLLKSDNETVFAYDFMFHSFVSRTCFILIMSSIYLVWSLSCLTLLHFHSFSPCSFWSSRLFSFAMSTSYDTLHKLFKCQRQTTWTEGRKETVCVYAKLTWQKDMNRWQAADIIPLLMSDLPICPRVCSSYMYMYFVHTYGCGCMCAVHTWTCMCVCVSVFVQMNVWWCETWAAAAVGMLLQS